MGDGPDRSPLAFGLAAALVGVVAGLFGGEFVAFAGGLHGRFVVLLGELGLVSGRVRLGDFALGIAGRAA